MNICRHTTDRIIKKYSLAISYLHDRNFVFHDGEIKSKYFIILSNLIENSYIYTLTTSQLDTYKASIHDVCEITDPVFPKKYIVEINRVDLISIKKMMIKVNNHDLDNVGVISKGNLDYILDMISESDFVNGNIKNIVIDMICEE